MDDLTKDMFNMHPGLELLKEQLTSEALRHGLVLRVALLPRLPQYTPEEEPPMPPTQPCLDDMLFIDEDNDDEADERPSSSQGSQDQERRQASGILFNSGYSFEAPPPYPPYSYLGKEGNTAAIGGTCPDVSRYLQVANGRYKYLLDGILEVFLKGVGSFYTQEHSTTINFEMGFTNAQCTCEECYLMYHV